MPRKSSLWSGKHTRAIVFVSVIVVVVVGPDIDVLNRRPNSRHVVLYLYMILDRSVYTHDVL